MRLLYFILGIYSVLLNWHFNESILYAILSWIFWPIYIIYSILTKHLSHGQWLEIPLSYFK